MNQYFVCREKCPACNSRRFSEVYRNPYDEPPVSTYLESFYSGKVELKYLRNASFCLCECEECQLIFQKEIPNDHLMKVLYEEWIDPQTSYLSDQERDDQDLYWYYSQEIAAAIKFLGRMPSELEFFDFGMGWGKWALIAKGFGCDSFGAELSEERINFAISNGIKIVEWDDIPDHKFDFVNTEQVFEHIPDPYQTLCHLRKSLKPGGLLKISVPTAADISKRLKLMDWNAPKGSKNSLNAVAPLEHINCYKRQSLAKMAEEAGMEEVLMPMRIQYMYATNWSGPKKIAKNILFPILRNVMKSKNYVFLRNKQP